jgi:hypothetical protein
MDLSPAVDKVGYKDLYGRDRESVQKKTRLAATG